MKKIITILVFAAVLGLVMGSVTAADLQAHDFDGKFTLDVPGNYWMGVGSPANTYDNGNGVKITYYTLDDIHKRGNTDFDDYINELVGKGLKPIGNESNIAMYKNNDKYTVFIHSDDEIYAITDPDLDEAKAIAASARLGGTEATPSEGNSTTAASNTTDTSDLEEVTVGDFLTIDAPKGTEFNNGTFDGFWTVYSAPSCDAVVYYTNGELANTPLDDAYYDEFIKNVTSQKGVKSSEIDNVTVVEGIQNIDGTNAAYVHGDNAMVIVVSNDLNLVKNMAQSVEFK